jgi:predicted RNase H-like nuclease (RuvC/YqgF family)
MKQKPIRGNKTNKRRLEFGNGSLERKVQRQEREQSNFDAETERIIKKFSGNQKGSS